ESQRAKFVLKEGKYRVKVTVHMGTCGISAGARKIMTALIDELSKHNLEDVVVTTSGCAGLCSHEPMITVETKDLPPVKYVKLTENKIKEIVEEHIIKGNIVEKYAFSVGSETTY
ncbi:MAG: (2Fe-2S) ferredoxin domain-containing protein, partial [Nitrospirae bacterium]